MSNPLVDYFFRPPLCETRLFVLFGDPNASVIAPNSSGLTPLKAAVMQAEESFVSLLIANGAVVDAELLSFAEERYPHKAGVIAVLRAAAMEAQINGHGLPNSPSSAPPRRQRVEAYDVA